MSRLGIIFSGIVQHTYLSEVFAGVNDAAQQNRSTLTVNIQHSRRKDDLRQFLQHCEGVVIILPFNFEQVLQLCREYRREIVLIDYPAAGTPEYPTVGATNRAGILSVMEHLFALGHRRIGFINGEPEHAAAHERLLAYQEALAGAEIAYDPALVGAGRWLEADSYHAAVKVLAQRPTAIVGACDEAAIGAYQAARELGLQIGTDISITGFDDEPRAAWLVPPLTTVHQPMYQFGQVAVELLVKRLKGEPLPEMHVRLPTELVIRQSTGPAPHHTSG